MSMAMNLSSLTLNPNPFHSLSTKFQLKPSRVSVITCSTTTACTSNFYNMLCVHPESATMADIKRAYRSMALRHHPDVCRDAAAKEESTRMFVELNAAYETLSNPRLRHEYDRKVLGFRKRMSNEEEGIIGRRKWEEQVVELKKRSNRRMGQKGKERSWGSSIRAQRMNKNNHD